MNQLLPVTPFNSKTDKQKLPSSILLHVRKWGNTYKTTFFMLSILCICMGYAQHIEAQCQPGVTVPVYQVDLEGSPGGYVAGSYTLGGECCPIQGQNSCLILQITVGTEFTGAGICFDPPCSTVGYLFPSTATSFCPLPGAGFNVCQTVICNPPEGNTFYLLLCKPGAASNPLEITVYGVAEPDLNVTDVTEGCITTFNVDGAVEFTCNGGNAPPSETPLPLTWTTDTPGALAYLSCTDCANPSFEYTGPPVNDCDGLSISYTVSIPETACFDSISVTKTLTIYPDVSGTITTECDATNTNITLTFVPDLPCPDLSYTWTNESNMVVGSMSSITVPADGSQYCLSVSRTDTPLCSPFSGCVDAICCTLEVGCPPANGGVFDCIADIPAADPGIITIIDSCGPVTITFSDMTMGTGCDLDSFMVIRTYLINDGLDEDTCIQVFKAVDNVSPAFTFVPENTTISCESMPVFGTPTVTDNCDTSVVVTSSVTTAPTANCAGGTTTITWTATDDCGNTATASQTLTLVDATPPTFTFIPANTTIECNAMPVFGTPTATDNCDTEVSITSATSSDPMANCAGGTTTIVWTATDNCGNTATASQTLTFVDNQAPVFTFVPANTTIECNTTPVFGTPTASDNCDTDVTITSVSSSDPMANCAGGTTTMVWTATDNCGNTATASQTLTYVDVQAPLFTFVPANTTIQCDIAPAFGTPTATDNCDTDVAITFTTTTAPTANCAGGTTTRVWTATDNCGNTATASQTITFIDTEAPVFTFVPADATVACSATPAFGTPTATDNCDTDVAITSTTTTNPTVNCAGGTSTRVWTATDNCGNTSTASQTLTFIDNTAPTITCPADTTVQCASLVPAPDPSSVTASDDCGGTPAVIFVSDVPSTPVCPNNFTITRTYLATDACGNTATCTQVITVFDDTPPTIVCPADMTVNCDASTSPDLTGTATATDNCGGLPVIVMNDVITDGTCPQEFTITRTFTATDICGNSAACTQIITVQDTVPPAFDTLVCETEFDFYTSLGSTCPMESEVSILLNVAQGIPLGLDETWTVGNNTIPSFLGCLSDNCSIADSLLIMASSVQITGDSCMATITVVFDISDQCGNSIPGGVTMIVRVHDDTPPVFTEVPADVTVQCDSVPPMATLTAIDNCSDEVTVFPASSITPGSCPDSYVIFRSWTATDECGNMATASQTVTVIDTEAPVFAGVPANITVQCNAVPPPATPTASDNCDAMVTIAFNSTTTPGACPDNYTILRVWTATDNCGNSSTASQTIVVIDTQAPVLAGIPADITVQCNAVPPPATPTATDNCDAMVGITLVETQTPGACADSYTLLRTWTATDNCGNTATASQTIVVIDTQAPVLAGVPANITVQCDAVPPPATPTATDNCDTLVSITFDEVQTPGACPDSYSLLRTWTASDNCGNTTTASQTIVVIDTQAPVLAGVPANITVQCDAVPPPAMPTATDNCDTLVAITFDQIQSPGACPDSYTLLRTWTATDNCGNTAFASQTIVVVDTQAPVFQGIPANVTVQCDAVPPPASPTATDNCDTMVMIVFAETSLQGPCEDTYLLIRSWTATDNCGNTSSASQTLVVIDTQAPVFAGIPANITVQCNAVPPPAMPTATDNCDTMVTIVFNEVTIPGSCPDSYTIVRTWLATDNCANATSATQTITVIDTQAPVFAGVPANVTVQCNAVPPPAMPTATDNCDTLVTIAFNESTTPGACPDNYTILRVWTATDNCGNSATASQSIVVIDTQPPVLAGIPANVTVQCDAVPPPATPTATDNCDTMVTITFDQIQTPGLCPDNYTLIRIWGATDNCGNTTTASQTIVVVDTQAPVLAGIPANVTVQCNAVPPPATPTATDNCDAMVTIGFAQTAIPGACPDNYTLIRTWTATDNCGNSSSASQTIVVVDTQAPVLVGIPANVTVQCNAVPPPAMPSATDNCDEMVAISFTETTTPGSCPDNYTITRTWTATDNCANATTGTQTLVVVDTQPPVFAGIPANITVQCNAVPPPASPTATDNCDAMVTINFTEVTIPGACPDSYTLIRSWTATDNCSNATTATQTIVVIDTQAPVFGGVPANITVQCNAVPPAATPTATDNCDTMVTIVFVQTTIPGACPDSYTLVRTWTATDNCANVSTATQTVTVVDTQAPVFSGIPANVTVQCDAVPPPAMPTATDNCDEGVTIAFMETDTPGSCPNNYTLTRTWTATDNCNNSTTATQTVTVIDTQAPMITCPANVTVQCAGLVPPVNTASVTTTDNCDGIVTVTAVPDVISNMTCANRFVITRVYVATDVCGNSATCAQTITVFDDTPPALTCPAGVTVQCASQVPAVNTASVTATDNCGETATITHVSDVVSNMTCPNRFTVTRTYRATDVCGNSATCTQTITVFDDTPPTLTCPAAVTVQCASLVPAVNTAAVTSTDNCGGTATITHVGDVITNMTCANRFILTRTYRATDACGNSATCSQVITVFDNTPPTITCPAPVTVQCASQVPPVNTGSVVTADNCGGAVTVTHVSDAISNMTCVNRFILTRTYRATDVCGNSATCTQVITVFDNTAPVITFTDPLLEGVPNGGTVQVQCFGQDPEWELPTFNAGSISVTDNCAGTVTVVFTDVLVDEGDCDVDGYINQYRLTWTATDACGNSSSAFVFLELVDTIPPVIHNIPEDITVSCDEIPAPPSNIFATDECLCACVILFEESDPAPGCQDGQVITRTWTAEDDCGNITVEVQNITLVDDEGPEIIMMHPELSGIANGTVLQYSCNEGGIPAFFDELNAESVSSPLSCGTSGIITFNNRNLVANNCKFWGYMEQRTFTWEGIDQCGNVSTFVVTAELIDTEPPAILGVPDMACIDDPMLEEVEAIDNCQNASLTYWDIPIENPCGTGEAYRRTYEAFDNCGNSVRDTVILVPNDQGAPVVQFLDPKLAELQPGEILIVECAAADGQYTPFGAEDATFTDACMTNPEVRFTENLMESGNCSDGVIAVVELVWSASDACGNIGEAVITAHIVDNTPPEFTNYHADLTIGCGDEMPAVSAMDNCGFVGVTTVEEIIPGACEFEYDVMRTHTASDLCGNVTVRRQMIHVRGSGPVIEGVIEEVCDDLSIPEVTAFDPCAGVFVEVTMLQDTLDVPCNDGMVIERVWSATDACGNVSEIVQHIVLNDQTPPEIQVPTNSIIRRFEGHPFNLVMLSQSGFMEQLNALNAGSVFVLDDCDQEIEAEFTLDVVYSDNCEEDGYFERRTYSWVATDVCGNSESIAFTVDIMDDIPPVFEGVPETETVICGDLPPVANVTATDPAGPVDMQYNEVVLSGDGPIEFMVTRTWTATDACGNSAQASQTIIWIPDTFLDCGVLLPGAVECNSHGVVIASNVAGGLGELSYVWEIEGEKCFIQSGQNTPEIIIYVGWSEVDITLTVTDAFGCSSVCSATLECLDPLDPFTTTTPEVIIADRPDTNMDPSDPDQRQSLLQHLNLWPNPANESVNLSFESSMGHEVEFTLTNNLGQVVAGEKFEAAKGFNSRKIDVSKLAEGNYLLQLVSDTETRTKMLVLFRN